MQLTSATEVLQAPMPHSPASDATTLQATVKREARPALLRTAASSSLRAGGGSVWGMHGRASATKQGAQTAPLA